MKTTQRRGKVCPRCHSAQTRPSQLKATDYLLRFLLLKPHRCRSCAHRFWRLGC